MVVDVVLEQGMGADGEAGLAVGQGGELCASWTTTST